MGPCVVLRAALLAVLCESAHSNLWAPSVPGAAAGNASHGSFPLSLSLQVHGHCRKSQSRCNYPETQRESRYLSTTLISYICV